MDRHLLATVFLSCVLLSPLTPVSGADVIPEPLHTAAAKDDRKAIKQLLNQGANINVQDTQGRTALLVALENRHFKTADWLITQGTDVTLKDTAQRSALYLAIANHNKAIAFRLILSNFDPNDNAADGKSVLELAAMQDWSDVVGVLIDKGADVCPSNQIHLLLAYQAGKQGYIRVVKRLSKKQTVGPFILAFYAPPKTVKTALERTRQTIHSFLPETKETLLHLACHGNNRRLAAYLVKAGVDLNATDISGQTPLHIATRHGYIGLVKLLLRAGINTGILDNNNQRAMDIARKKHTPKLIHLLQNRK